MSKTIISPSEEEPDIPGTINRVSAGEQFGPQWTPTSELPNPQTFVMNFTLRALEILHGSRDIAQIARWTSESVFLAMNKHVNAHVRKDSYTLAPSAARIAPHFVLGKPHLFSPRDGVIEACIVVQGNRRFQSAAMRIEGWDHRWRATSFAYL